MSPLRVQNTAQNVYLCPLWQQKKQALKNGQTLANATPAANAAVPAVEAPMATAVAPFIVEVDDVQTAASRDGATI